MTRASIEGQARTPGGPAAVRVSELLAPERVRVPLRAADKDGVISELVGLVAASLGLEAERDAIHRAVWERERVLSTGIGDGVALPHAKFNGLDEVVMVAGVTREPVEYGALDGKPARLFFLMLGPDRAAASQVKALSRIGRLLRDERLRERLVAARDAGEFRRLIEEAERSA
jgi:mannitol/fructose-specific phosphotransferase system IIA component (Ntr-type)